MSLWVDVYIFFYFQYLALLVMGQDRKISEYFWIVISKYLVVVYLCFEYVEAKAVLPRFTTNPFCLHGFIVTYCNNSWDLSTTEFKLQSMQFHQHILKVARDLLLSFHLCCCRWIINVQEPDHLLLSLQKSVFHCLI